MKRRLVLSTVLIVLGKTLLWTISVVFACGLFAAGAVAGFVASILQDEPVRPREEIMSKIRENTRTGYVYFRGGELVGQLRTEEDRDPVPLNQIPDIVKQAFLAIEDDRFYEHYGVSPTGLARAVYQQLTRAERQTGGSTITQQLARRLFLTLDRDVDRKVREIFLALRLERMLSKDEIFQAYLNKIPFGNGANGFNLYGIKAAAKGIFGIDDLGRLNLAQAAYLAGLPQQPSVYSAFTSKGTFDEEGFSKAVERQRLVLQRMLEVGFIDEAQYREALAFDLRSSLAQPRQKGYDRYPYLMMEVERRAPELLLQAKRPELVPGTPTYAEALKEAKEELLRGGYRIYTTVDKALYEEMRKIAENPANFTPDRKDGSGPEQIAAVAIENRTGAIVGMIEGRDFFVEQMNLATQMKRQPGSTMKPIAAYMPAIEMGKIQPASVIDDTPIILKDGQKKIHIPQNWNSKYNGLVTAREALNRSYNIPALKLFLYEVGIPTAWDYARKLGITTLTEKDAYAQTGVIGGLEYGVTVEELTNAYSAFPNEGVFRDAYLIEKIVDADGRVVYEHRQEPTSVFSRETAYLMTSMLRTVITDPRGTGNRITRLFKHFRDVEVAGKTGTTQDNADVWFIGYSPDVTVGVWAGYAQPKYKLTSSRCAPEPVGCGTQRAMRIWALVMDAAIDLHPDWFAQKRFVRPDTIVEATVSKVSGKWPSELVREAGLLNTDLFNVAYLPTSEDDVLIKARYVMYNGREYIPQPDTPADMVREKLMVRREKPIRELLAEIEQAQQQLPERDRRPLEEFIPVDYTGDPPTEPDPRVDDGQPPSPPSSVELQPDGNGQVRVSFAPASEADVVGYRLYRSVDGGPFVRMEGKTVYAGDPTVFTDALQPGTVQSYYVTAVDVAGRESPPSRQVSAGAPANEEGANPQHPPEVRPF